MEIDESDHPEAQQSSSTAALSENTKRRPESNEDVKMTLVKVSELACNVTTCQTISKISENSTSGRNATRNATRLQSDTMGSSSKAEIKTNTPGGALEPDAASKIARTSQNATNSTVTKSTNSAEATSTCAVRFPGSVSDATTPRVTASSCTTPSATASTSRQTASEMMATNSNDRITTSKLTEANDIPSAASKVETTVKHSEAASETVKSAKCGFAQVYPKTAHVQNSAGTNKVVGPIDVPKDSLRAAPHLAVSGRFEPVSMNKKRPGESLPKVGMYVLLLLCGAD